MHRRRGRGEEGAEDEEEGHHGQLNQQGKTQLKPVPSWKLDDREEAMTFCSPLGPNDSSRRCDAGDSPGRGKCPRQASVDSASNAARSGGGADGIMAHICVPTL